MNELTKQRAGDSSKTTSLLLYGYEAFYLFVTVVLNYGMWRQSQDHFVWQSVATALSIIHICYLFQALHVFRRVDLFIAIGFLLAQLMVIWKFAQLGSGWILVLILGQGLRMAWSAAADRATNSQQTAHPGSPSTSVTAQMQAASMAPANPTAAHDTHRFPAQWPKRVLDDIHGMEEVKQRLKRAATEIVAPSTDPSRHPNGRNGILLFGDPGNGKTALVDALAGEMGLKYITVTYGDVASKWINETTEHVMISFREAVAQAPCLLFFDEIDSLIPSRTSPAGGGFDETSKTTNSILTEIVNIRNKGVIVVGATNFLDKLDKAAIREGRFDYKIEVPTPDIHARLGILLESLMHNLPHVPYDPDSVHTVALRWDGYSVKRIQAVGEELAEMDRERPIIKVEGEQLLAALRRVQGRKGKIPADTKDIADLILPTKLRQKLTSISVRMKEFERVERLGGTVPAGLLFSGEPGTGKTETARSLAKASGWAFLFTSGNDLINNPAEIDRILAEAKDIRPCIVFIDEADDILANRRCRMSPL
ncbi:AAA family ATPase [Undibacterium arcticum]|uniref:AAA family ATPase n=1 Tax=Undibacterium arcticum TaxID=1762892 RepID=UPI003616A946